MQDRYDAIIVGAGIGGLLTGNFLVRKGLRTLLLEQHSQPGGYVCGFWRQGFYFDGGDQSFGSSGLVFPVLEQLGLRDAVRFVRADYRFKTPWADFKVDSLDHVQEAVAEAFPAHRGEIDAYFRELVPLVKAVCLFLDQPNPMMLTGWKKLSTTMGLFVKHWRVLKTLGSFTQLPGEELARRHFTDERLVKFFGCFGYRGSSALATAGAWGSWLYDYWYPVGGLQAFAELLARSFSEHGGEVRYRTRVTGVQTEGRPLKARGVLLEGGETLAGRFIVYAGDYRRLARDLLPKKGVDPAWRAEAAETPVSEPIFSVYLGVDLPREELTGLLQAHHVFVLPEEVRQPAGETMDADWHARRWVEISAPSVADPALAPPGQSSLVLQCMSAYGWMDRWGTAGAEDGDGTVRRTPRYRELKARVTAQLIQTAERVIPDLRRRIVVQDAATPLTLERYTLNSEGATAGWTWDSRRSPFKGMGGRYRTPVANLFAAGHWTGIPGGVPTAALSAKVVADLVR